MNLPDVTGLAPRRAPGVANLRAGRERERGSERERGREGEGGRERGRDERDEREREKKVKSVENYLDGDETRRVGRRWTRRPVPLSVAVPTHLPVALLGVDTNGLHGVINGVSAPGHDAALVRAVGEFGEWDGRKVW